jgi:basic amino acid/polyamine antiporter, APA family
MENLPVKLKRSLGALDATALVVGTVIGTGVFTKAAIMTYQLGSSGWVLLAWLIAGVFSLIGALTYAEIGALFPRAGGEYVYLKEAYSNPLLAFLFGWMRFWIASPGSIAAYAVGAATFISLYISDDLASSTSNVRTLIALGMIAFFTLLNCLSVQFGGKIQTILTALKSTVILGLAAALFLMSNPSTPNPLFSFLTASGEAPSFTLSQFGMAVLAALWAYDGWNNLPMCAGEVNNPGRNIPRALIFGTLAVMAIYLFINASYFYALPTEEVAKSFSSYNPNAQPVSTKAAASFLGDFGTRVLSLIMMISALGAMNGSILTGARVPYALAADGLFPKLFSKLGTSSATPVFSVLIQGVWSAVLAFSGTFDQLTDYVLFSSWIFYALVASTIFVFRKKLPSMPRPYKTWGYPILPALFIIFALVLVGNTLLTTPKESGIGLGLILLGIPVFLFMRRSSSN